MNDAQEYANILQDAKKLKAETAADMLKNKHGWRRRFLSAAHRLAAWAERQAREALNHSER